MIKKSFILLFLCTSFFVQAQYTELINANRPGFSESPYGVGPGVYQLEGGFFYRKAKAVELFSNPEAWGMNFHFRTGLLLEKLELNLTTALQQDKIAFKNVFESSYNKFGLGKFTIGAKYFIFEPKYEDKTKQIRSWTKRHQFDKKRWIPHIAGYVGVNFGSFLNEYHQHGGITPKVGILLQNEFSFQYNLITNVYYDYIGSDYPEWSYIITATYNFNSNWSGFVEHQAKFNKIEKQSNLGGGLAYLYTKDLQFNSSLRATFQEGGLGFYAGIGASYRLDYHKDRFVELDDYGNKINEEKGDPTYKKGFFGRLFDKITGIFKKKEKASSDVDTELGKDKKENNEGINTERTREKSVLDDFIKSDKKKKKKKGKSDRKKEKEIEKQKRKEEKERQKKEKQKHKEEEKLLKKKHKEEEKLLKQKRKEEEKLINQKMKEQKKLEKEKRKEEERLIQEKMKEQKEEEKLKKEQEKLDKEIEEINKKLEKEKKED